MKNSLKISTFKEIKVHSCVCDNNIFYSKILPLVNTESLLRNDLKFAGEELEKLSTEDN